MTEELKTEELNIDETVKVVKKRKGKKYTIEYTIGLNPEIRISHGDDYKLSTMDIESPRTHEVFSVPVLFLFDEKGDTLEIIHEADFGRIKHNYGVQEESNHFMTEMQALQEKASEQEKKDLIKHKLQQESDDMHYQ